jgi:hypothetical protein
LSQGDADVFDGLLGSSRAPPQPKTPTSGQLK